MVGGERGEICLAVADVARWHDEPFDGVVNQLQDVEVLGVEQIEVASRQGQVVLGPALTLLQFVLGGWWCRRVVLRLRVGAVFIIRSASCPADPHQRGQRQPL